MDNNLFYSYSIFIIIASILNLCFHIERQRKPDNVIKRQRLKREKQLKK